MRKEGGRIFQAPRDSELEQEAGKELSSSPSTVMVVLVFFTWKLRVPMWCVGFFLIGAS